MDFGEEFYGWSADNVPGAMWFLSTMVSLYSFTYTGGGVQRQSSFYYGSEVECPVNNVTISDMSCIGVASKRGVLETSPGK